MSVRQVIEFFSKFTRLPIYAEDVRDHIVELGIQDEIIFREMDCDPQQLLGQFVRFRRREVIYGGNPRNCVYVYYNKHVSPELQNLICIKEIMHVFDGTNGAAINNAEKFRTLIDDLFADFSPLELSPGGFMDQAALVMALAVMFPHEIRENFIEANKSNRMTLQNIGDTCGLPHGVISRLISPEWEMVRQTLMRTK